MWPKNIERFVSSKECTANSAWDSQINARINARKRKNNFRCDTHAKKKSQRLTRSGLIQNLTFWFLPKYDAFICISSPHTKVQPFVIFMFFNVFTDRAAAALFQSVRQPAIVTQFSLLRPMTPPSYSKFRTFETIIRFQRLAQSDPKNPLQIQSQGNSWKRTTKSAY